MLIRIDNRWQGSGEGLGGNRRNRSDLAQAERMLEKVDCYTERRFFLHTGQSDQDAIGPRRSADFEGSTSLRAAALRFQSGAQQRVIDDESTRLAMRRQESAGS